MRIAQVSFAETGGGAERVATDLHDVFLERGHDAVLLTPRPDEGSTRAGLIPIHTNVGRGWLERTLLRIDRRLPRPLAALRRRRGFDDPHHPWTASLLDLLPWPADQTDVLHLHNLHGNWFDLRQLGPLSRRVPTVLTLHDAWLPMGGPHVTIHRNCWDTEALRANHALREAALDEAAFTVVTPSRWMKGVWDSSPWSLKVGDAVVIPNGIDLDTFTSNARRSTGDQAESRLNERTILSVGLAGRGQPSHADLDAMLSVPQMLPTTARPVRLVSMGSRLPVSAIGLSGEGLRLEQPGRISDRVELASYYRSADVLLHPVREDNFPSVVLEAMACGTPVVAPRVGGIGEQFVHGEHGLFYLPANHEEAATHLESLLTQPATRQAFSQAAAAHAFARFHRRRMAEDYLSLYAELNA